MTTRNKIPLMAQFDWRDQAAAEQAAWIVANSPNMPCDRLADFDTGFKLGWDRAISALSLHGFVERS